MFIGVILRVLAPLVKQWMAKRNQNQQPQTVQQPQPVPQPPAASSPPATDGIGFGGGVRARRQRRSSRW